MIKIYIAASIVYCFGICECIVVLQLNAEKILVEYDNGELETIEITRAEPDEGFNPPSVGTTICVKSRGGKYSKRLLRYVLVYSIY